ncbi:cytochrome P450 [Galbibacter sp. EGI 63066]|uniref:cytochrome P450 n=1 Tax=Galbibacter sp. EGI 63066 TaxID=2993559 RepID=UPI002248ED10|nr:cytochrome P450 [Galbibacter sp. EGI 63066]MCX2681806.1 cytochrome P450 [Galbibacter sp. EGI 63066]
MKQYNYPNKVSFLKFIRHSSAIAKNPIPFHSEMFKNTGESFSIKSIFGPKVILTKDADISKHILQKHHKKYEKSKLQTKYVSKYIGRGLLTATGGYWLQQRRLIQPGFHKDKIKNLVAIINETIYEQIHNFKTGSFIDLFLLMNTLAFEVVAKSLFNFSADPEVLKRLQFIIERLQRFAVKEMRQPHNRIWYQLKGQTARHMRLVVESREIINKIIEQRRASTARHDDLLDMLLKAEYEDGGKMTNDQLIDEILILFVAGHETTANALTFTLFLLASHPLELEKVCMESVDLRDSNNALEVLPQLQHIKMCVEESMRLYPSAWITDRVALEDDTVSGFHIKKGTLFGISIYEMHRNPKYWENPEDFIPERFSEGKKYKAYMPFGAGPRLCIGNNFAMYEMLLAINAIVNTFAIETNKDSVQLNPLITLKPVDVEIKFSKRA